MYVDDENTRLRFEGSPSPPSSFPIFKNFLPYKKKKKVIIKENSINQSMYENTRLSFEGELLLLFPSLLFLFFKENIFFHKNKKNSHPPL